MRDKAQIQSDGVRSALGFHATIVTLKSHRRALLKLVFKMVFNKAPDTGSEA